MSPENRKPPIRRTKPAGNKSLSKQVEDSAKKKIEKPVLFNPEDLMPSGATLLNCSCSDTPYGAFHKGKIITLPGKSKSGKSFFALTSLAEAGLLSKFDLYDFIYDDVEEACEFNLQYLFNNIAHRIKAPNYDGNDPIFSNTIQDFQASILRRTQCKKPKPFIWIEDSLDALTSDEELEKEYLRAMARVKSKEDADKITGSYKTEKAKILGTVLRMVKGELKKTGSILILVQQLRDKIGVTFGKKTGTSGGHAPFYYSSHQAWFNVISAHKDQGEKIGAKVNIDLIKNKLTGKERSFDIDLYYDYGVDDVGCCIDFLCKRKYLDNDVDGQGAKKPNTWIIPELNLVGQKGFLKDTIRSDLSMFPEIQRMVGEAWYQKEESLRLGWVPKYG